MNLPKMICFDYGETLVHEEKFDGQKGYAEILKYAEVNKYHRTAEELAGLAAEMNAALGRFDPARRHLFQTEIHDTAFQAYLLESQGIKLTVPYPKLAAAFWEAAAPGKATEGVEEFLVFLRNRHILTSVISNISYSGETVKNRLAKIFPNHEFDFIIASSEYVFRKPSIKIFELALEKAGLKAEETWHCGDQYKCDIEGALQAGIQAVWYTTEENCIKQYEDGVITISKWEELRKKIQLLY